MMFAAAGTNLKSRLSREKKHQETPAGLESWEGMQQGFRKGPPGTGAPC